MSVTINNEQKLYVIKSPTGYSCLGFEVAERWRAAYLNWLGQPITPVTIGTIEAYEAYRAAENLVSERCNRTGERCPAQLTRELIGLERKRVEVTYPDGTKTRFWVGKSMGHIPIHLEIKTRRSTGGCAAYIPEGSRVRVVA